MMKLKLIILLEIVILLCFNCSDSHKTYSVNKYTISDKEFVNISLQISKNIFSNFNDAAAKLKKYPNIDIQDVFKIFRKIINDIDKANKIPTPDNFKDTYYLWLKSLNDYKTALEMHMEGYEKKDINLVSKSNELLGNGTKSLQVATEQLKRDNEELSKYYHENK